MRKDAIFRGLGNVEYRITKVISRDELLYRKDNLEERINREFGSEIGRGIANKLIIERNEIIESGHTEFRTNVYILTQEEMRAVVINIKEEVLHEARWLQQLSNNDKNQAPAD